MNGKFVMIRVRDRQGNILEEGVERLIQAGVEAGLVAPYSKPEVLDGNQSDRDSMNSLRVIFPYKRDGVWAFDDPSVGLLQEPFVLGMPEIIEHFVNGVADAEDGFALFFSDSPFPQFHGELEWVREDCGGNWYREKTTRMEGWLCPALFHYFDVAPMRLYLAIAPK